METLYESTASLFVLIIFWMLPNEIFDVQSNIFSFCIFGLFSLMNCIFLKNGLNYDFWRLVHTSLPNYFHATITMFGRVTGCCSIHRENLSPSPSISFPQCIPPPVAYDGWGTLRAVVGGRKSWKLYPILAWMSLPFVHSSRPWMLPCTILSVFGLSLAVGYQAQMFVPVKELLVAQHSIKTVSWWNSPNTSHLNLLTELSYYQAIRS